MNKATKKRKRPKFNIDDLDRNIKYLPKQPHYGLNDRQYIEVFEMYQPLLSNRQRTRVSVTEIIFHSA